MMSALLTKMAISLEPRVGHTHIIPRLKALIFPYLTMKHILQSDLEVRLKEK